MAAGGFSLWWQKLGLEMLCTYFSTFDFNLGVNFDAHYCDE